MIFYSQLDHFLTPKSPGVFDVVEGRYHRSRRRDGRRLGTARPAVEHQLSLLPHVGGRMAADPVNFGAGQPPNASQRGGLVIFSDLGLRTCHSKVSQAGTRSHAHYEAKSYLHWLKFLHVDSWLERAPGRAHMHDCHRLRNPLYFL